MGPGSAEEGTGSAAHGVSSSEEGGQPGWGWRTAWMKLQLGGALSLEPVVWTDFMVR